MMGLKVLGEDLPPILEVRTSSLAKWDSKDQWQKLRTTATNTTNNTTLYFRNKLYNKVCSNVTLEESPAIIHQFKPTQTHMYNYIKALLHFIS